LKFSFFSFVARGNDRTVFVPFNYNLEAKTDGITELQFERYMVRRSTVKLAGILRPGPHYAGES